MSANQEPEDPELKCIPDPKQISLKILNEFIKHGNEEERDWASKKKKLFCKKYEISDDSIVESLKAMVAAKGTDLVVTKIANFFGIPDPITLMIKTYLKNKYNQQ